MTTNNLQTIKKYVKIIGLILIFLLTLLIIFNIYNCYQNNKLENQYEHNIEALNDSVRYYTMKNGEMYAEKKLYVTEINDLKNLNKELYDEVITLQKEIGKKNEIIAGFKTELVYHKDTVINIIINDSLTPVDTCIEYEDNILDLFLDFKSDTNNRLFLTNIDYGLIIPVSAYITSSGEIILKSDDNIKFNKLNGFMIPELYKETKKKRFSVGIQLGLGAASGYNPFDKKYSLIFGSYIGIGISYNLFSF